jgi:hypothetical protein
MRKSVILLALINLLVSKESIAQNRAIDPLSNRYSFGNARESKLYKALADLDNDSTDRSLVTACILGAGFEELRDKNFPNLKQRIDRLLASGVLKLTEDKYYLSFPVILGKKRALLYDLVWRKAMALLPATEPVLGKLGKELENQQYISFQIFWSNILHNVFTKLWHKEFPDEKLDPSEIWLVYPQHPFIVESYFIDLENKGEMSISLNNHCIQNLSAIVGLKSILYSKALNSAGSKENDIQLKNFGFINEAGNSRIFYYTDGDKLDKICRDLTEQLLPSFEKLYDYKSLGETFEISEKEIFLIVLHETAYSLFENMQHLNKMELPAPLRNDSSSASMVQLVSLKLRDKVK